MPKKKTDDRETTPYFPIGKEECKKLKTKTNKELKFVKTYSFSKLEEIAKNTSRSNNEITKESHDSWKIEDTSTFLIKFLSLLKIIKLEKISYVHIADTASLLHLPNEKNGEIKRAQVKDIIDYFYTIQNPSITYNLPKTYGASSFIRIYFACKQILCTQKHDTLASGHRFDKPYKKQGGTRIDRILRHMGQCEIYKYSIEKQALENEIPPEIIDEVFVILFETAIVAFTKIREIARDFNINPDDHDEIMLFRTNHMHLLVKNAFDFALKEVLRFKN